MFLAFLMLAMTSTPVVAFERPATLRERVESYLRELIMQGGLLPGQRLREQALCEQLQVSRATLREALRTLEAERLINIQPHRGPVVASMSVKAANDLYAMRALLEGYAAREFAKQADNASLKALKQAFKQLQQLSGTADKVALLEAKQVFYDVLLRGCDNDVVAEILPSLLTRINLLRATSFSRADRTPESLQEIAQIVQAIEFRDAAGAERAARKHIKQAQKAAIEVLCTQKQQTESETSDE